MNKKLRKVSPICSFSSYKKSASPIDQMVYGRITGFAYETCVALTSEIHRDADECR